MSLKFDIKDFGFGGVAAYGWQPFDGKFGGGIFGHEFTMVATLLIKHSSDIIKKTTIDVSLPKLVWREIEFWWERNANGTWDYKGENDKGDLYATSPGSPTWGGFAQNVSDLTGHVWLQNIGAPVETGLRSKLFDVTQNAALMKATTALQQIKNSKDYKALEANKSLKYMERQDAIALLIAKTFAENKVSLLVPALDRPGMAKSGGSGASGGGFVSKTTAPSRRRVLQFELGMVGNPTKFTATQILETIDAVPSISKFIIPGQTDEWCKNIPERYLQFWRGHINLNDVYDQTTALEFDSVVSNWVANQPATPPANTPWVKGVSPGANQWVKGVIPGGNG